MTFVRVAGSNVENLFARPGAFGPMSEAAGDAAVVAHADFNRLTAKAEYSDADHTRMRELLTILGIYVVNGAGALRRSSSPGWAWLRKNRGHLDRQPRDVTEDSCGIRNRLDYILLTTDIVPAVTGGGLWRMACGAAARPDPRHGRRTRR